MTDQLFIDSILKGGISMHKTVDWFYHENKNLVYKLMASHKLSKEEVLDAYSDSITAFVENIRNNRFRGESNSKTYFIRIFNNKCIDIIRKKTTNRIDTNIISLDDMKTEPVPIEVDDEQEVDYTGYINQLSDVCREVLMDWSDGYTMDEIAVRNGLKNEHTARSKRYNCFRQLMELLRKHQLTNTNFNVSTDGE